MVVQPANSRQWLHKIISSTDIGFVITKINNPTQVPLIPSQHAPAIRLLAHPQCTPSASPTHLHQITSTGRFPQDTDNTHPMFLQLTPPIHILHRQRGVVVASSVLWVLIGSRGPWFESRRCHLFAAVMHPYREYNPKTWPRQVPGGIPNSKIDKHTVALFISKITDDNIIHNSVKSTFLVGLSC